MRQLIILYIFLGFFVPLSSQIEESFSDGNFSENPTWDGDVANFIVNSENQLQLNATSSGQSDIYVNTFIEKETEWQFYFKMVFNPSTSNGNRIYLQADDTDLLSSSGYFIEVGESGANDALKFYRQDNGSKQLLAMASMGAVAESPMVRVRILRENEGEWSIFANYTGGEDLSFETTVKDDTYAQSGLYFFGLYCKYTATRVKDFFYDDISIQALKVDISPPEVLDVKATEARTIEIIFNELIEENSGTNPANYSINIGIGTPESVSLVKPNQIALTLNEDLVSGQSYSININNIKDLNGNSLTNFETTFLYTKIQLAEQYDLIFNEIMEDPTLSGGGTLGLPSEEYVELYNRSNKTLNLEGFAFSDGGSRSAIFPAYIMPPNTFLIIGSSSASSLVDFGDFLGLPNFPTLSATEELVLTNEFGVILDVVAYSQDWYGNQNKAGGSFSLERINPQYPCIGANNWTASISFIGGTPGNLNSVLEESIPTETLNLVNAFPIDATHIQLTFDQAIDINDLMEITNYSVTNNQVIGMTLVENNFNQVTIELEKPLVPNEIETVELIPSFSNCIGIPISENRRLPIALAVLASFNDIIINEILFNPQTGGVDFVEIFNRSENVIDLNQLFIVNLAVNEPSPKPITTKKLFFPNDYAVFTKNPIDLQNRYIIENPDVLLFQDLPTFADKEGNVSIYTYDGIGTIFIDQFDYKDDFHNPLLNDKNGVSLERINPDLPTQTAGNWQSAAAAQGFATPTYKNSQRIEINEEKSTIFSLSGNRISPDGDGFEDVLQINYSTEGAGYSATIYIYDAVGRLIDKLAQNELLSTIGSFKWEGITSDGQKAKIGIYVLWIEYLNLNGEVGQMKEAIVVAGKL